MTATDPAGVVAGVEDPELPHVTIGDLGMVRRVTVDAGVVHAVLCPTYTGCPATEQIHDDVVTALAAAGHDNAVVEFEMSPPWSTADITEVGRDKLAAAGIAPPGTVGQGPVTIAPPAVCPNCGSRRTRLTAAFGATACKALHHCEACRQPFESFKAI